MKSFVNTMSALAIGVLLASCGNKTATPANDQDSAQIVLSDSVITQLDSIASIIGDAAGVDNFVAKLKSGELSLSEQQKKVKPDYLLTKTDISDLQTLQEKYVAMGYLAIDNAVAAAYAMEDDDFYQTANERLATETDIANEEKSEKAKKAPLSIDNAKAFYAEMKKRNRLDVFFTAETAYCVEALYIISNNIDAYSPVLTDSVAATLAQHVSLAASGMQKLSEGNAQMAKMVATLKPVMNLKASNAAELKKEVAGMKEQLATMRKELIKN